MGSDRVFSARDRVSRSGSVVSAGLNGSVLPRLKGELEGTTEPVFFSVP